MWIQKNGLQLIYVVLKVLEGVIIFGRASLSSSEMGERVNRLNNERQIGKDEITRQENETT